MAIKQFGLAQSVEPFDKCTERAIVKRLQTGDSEALIEIYEKYKNPLTCFLNGFIHDPIESEDLAHDTFIRFYQKINDFKGKSRLSTYLYAIGKNLAIDTLRAKTLHKTDLVEVNDAQDETPRDFMTPEQHVLNAEILSAFNGALKKFPRRTARLLELHFIEQKTHKEISEELKITVARSKSLLSENRGRLQEALQPLRLETV